MFSIMLEYLFYFFYQPKSDIQGRQAEMVLPNMK